MLVGYVSDERFVALDQVGIEFERDGETVAVVRSTPRGRVIADLAPGRYDVTLRKDGFGRKRVMAVEVGPDQAPYQFRLLNDRLTGFVWPRWVRAGERAELLFHALEPYRLSLWRYGQQREFVRYLGWWDEHGPDAVMQITPDGDYTQTGVAFNKVGYGNPHHTSMVTAPDAGGLFYVEAEGESGAFFAAPWVVAPGAEAEASPIAVVLSTNTWNAYNNFGGRSNYVNATGLPSQPVVNGRQELSRYKPLSAADWVAPDEAFLPLSFQRPEPFNSVPRDADPNDPIRGRQPNHLAPAEWRLLAWLEREGFSYDVYSDAQLDDGTLNLAAHKVLLISAHPEYWTRRQYERTLDWVEGGGGRLMYLGGNGLNCEVEYPTPTTMHAKSHLAAVNGSLGQPDPANPGRWFDSRFHRTAGPEARLLGLATTETGIMTAAPYRVIESDHWVFEGLDLRAGDVFGTKSQHERVSGGASGHETDKMSAQSPAGTVLLAKGLNPDDGGAEIVTFETPSGGAVFSVGSIVWPASLLVDDGIARITRNVLDRFLRD